MIKKTIYTALVLMITFFGTNVSAQPDVHFWNKAGYLNISGGTVKPGVDFSNATGSGLYAKNGYQFGVDINYMIAFGWGFGFNLEYNRFNFDKDAFLTYAQPETYLIKGGYSSTKFGLNVLFNMPVLLGTDKRVLNFYAEGNAGLRSMNIPDIDLTYNEIANKYVDVTYRPRSNTMGYLGYSAGLQFLFSNKYGVNLSYNAVLPSKHSIKYSARMFDASGNLYEEENFLNDYLDHTGFQIGFMFLFGRK